jgi:hypothetical protein
MMTTLTENDVGELFQVFSQRQISGNDILYEDGEYLLLLEYKPGGKLNNGYLRHKFYRFKTNDISWWHFTNVASYVKRAKEIP